MPLFGSRKPTGQAPPASTLSIIASGMRVTGDITCDGVLRIDGTLEGRILGARQVLVTPGGRVQGDVEADEIVVGGVIDGSVRAAVRLELQGSAVVNGNIETRAFVVPEGGRVNGDIRMLGGEERVRTEPLLLQSRAAPASPEPEAAEVILEVVAEEAPQEDSEDASHAPLPAERVVDEAGMDERGTDVVSPSDDVDGVPHAELQEQTEQQAEAAEQRSERRLSKRERRRLKKGR